MNSIPITNERREWLKYNDPYISTDIDCYEALVVELEQKIEDKSLKILALTEEMMEAAEASSVKVLDLERRLRIATRTLQRMVDGGCCDDGELLSCTTDMAEKALAAMAKESQ